MPSYRRYAAALALVLSGTAALTGCQAQAGPTDPNTPLTVGATAADGIAKEKAAGNPYTNILVTDRKHADDPRVQKLGELLCSPETKKFLAEKYHGDVVSGCQS